MALSYNGAELYYSSLKDAGHVKHDNLRNDSSAETYDESSC